MENLNKPIQMVMKQMRQDIINTINISQLPMSIVELIVKDIYTDIKAASNVEYTQVVKNYNQQLEEANKENATGE